MTERLAAMQARVQAVRDLSSVVNAMRGMAAARLEQARGRMRAMRAYADVVDSALRTGLTLEGLAAPQASPAKRRALVYFCAEQGFAGPFSERVLDAAPDLRADDWVVLVGTRGRSVAADRARAIAWSVAMPARVQGLARLADQIVERLAPGIAQGEFDQLDVVFTACAQGMPLQVRTEALLPLPAPARGSTPLPPLPLTQLPPRALLFDFVAAHLHAGVYCAALRAFEAEAQARMETMAAAHRHIDQELAALQGIWQQMRQEDITAEIVELAAGQLAFQPRRRRVHKPTSMQS